MAKKVETFVGNVAQEKLDALQMAMEKIEKSFGNCYCGVRSVNYRINGGTANTKITIEL